MNTCPMEAWTPSFLVRTSKNIVIYFQSFDDTYQALTLLSHLILTCMSWLQQKEEDLHFLLSDNGNYDFDVKIIKCNLNYFLSLFE